MMWSAPSNHKFYAYATQFSESHIIPDNEEEEEGRSSYVSGEREEQEPHLAQQQPMEKDLPSTMSETQRELPVLIKFADEIEREPLHEPLDVTSKQAALRKCHNRLNHMPFARIQAMAKMGLLPRYLAKVKPPMCASCAYGKGTQQPWRVKGGQGRATE
jgi:predicted RNA-binding protein YlxR (DUF448 family)